VKADKETQTQVTLTLKAMFDAYSKRDLNGFLSFWAPDPDVFMLGSGADEKSVGIQEFVKSLKRDWGQSDAASIEHKDIAVSMAGSVSWFTTDIIIHGKINTEKFTLPCRLTGVMEKRNGNWLLMQMHFSIPNIQQTPGQSWPKPQSQT
jgi:ketosteroid isomerase-like protein